MTFTCASSLKVLMGITTSKAEAEVRRQHRIAEQILAEERRRENSLFKLLLLGAGDSGKSTIVKQMKILHKNGFSEEEVARNRALIFGGVVQSMAVIVRAMASLQIKFEAPEREADSHHILHISIDWNVPLNLTMEDWKCLKRLWSDRGVKSCFQRAHEFQLPDSTKYFCDQLERISLPDYAPTQQDMLHCRVSTIGIVEIEFFLRGLTIKVIDVGGQRSQRKKWIHCFENVNGLIFVAAVSEYNQTLMEDQNVNRILESMKLFGTVINSQWFAKTSVVLFLNKKDIFAEKIKQYPLTITFPDYKGGRDYELAMNYLQKTFEDQKHDSDKLIYTHRTCATDTKNVEFVLEACFDIMLTKNLSRSGLY